jgi:plasmid stabilization system protein ParE
MNAIEWSLGAEQQLFEIRLSFATSAAQDRFEKHLDAALEQLEAFPESARMNPTLRRQDVRSLLVGDYRLTVPAVGRSFAGVLNGLRALWGGI